MHEIIKWMTAEGIAKNDFNAAAIVNGLQLYKLNNEAEQKARVKRYRQWRGTDKKNQLPTKQAFDLAIAGIERDDVIDRQIEMVIE